jgi:hypothetical protein
VPDPVTGGPALGLANSKNPAPTPFGYGIRVPALVISPWVKPGSIDHQFLSFDSYLKFVEDIFLNSQPITDSDPQFRRDLLGNQIVRETVKNLIDPRNGGAIPVGDLLNDFDFSQSPLDPLIEPVTIPVQFQASFDSYGTNIFPLFWQPVTTATNTVPLQLVNYTVWGTPTSGQDYQAVCVLPASTPAAQLKCSDTHAPPGIERHYVITSTYRIPNPSPYLAQSWLCAPDPGDGAWLLCSSPPSGEIDVVP